MTVTTTRMPAPEAVGRRAAEILDTMQAAPG